MWEMDLCRTAYGLLRRVHKTKTPNLVPTIELGVIAEMDKSILRLLLVPIWALVYSVSFKITLPHVSSMTLIKWGGLQLSGDAPIFSLREIPISEWVSERVF